MPSVQPDSLYALTFPSDPQLSPDGRRAVFVLTRIEEEDPLAADPAFPKPRYRSRLQLTDGGPARDLTAGRGRDASPRWSPDGRTIAFLSDRDERTKGRMQLYVLAPDGGEARQLTTFKTGVSGAEWSPDGQFLSFQSRGDTEDKREERGEPYATEALSYRSNGRGLLPETPAALYLHRLDSGETRLWHQPEQPISDYAWWPDGRGVLLVSSLSNTDAAQWRSEVFDLPLEGERRQLTSWAAPIGNLAPHPDGVRFAGVGRAPGTLNTQDPHVFLFSESGEGRRLDGGWDRPTSNIVAGDLHVGSFPERPRWRDEQILTLLSTLGGSTAIIELGLDGEVQVQQHDPERLISAFSLQAGQLAWLSESVTEPPELYLNGERITHQGATLPFTPRGAQRVTFQNELGEGEGWVMLPEGDGPFPALLNIHGGPHTAYGHGFMHEFQLFAQQGYAVCYSNPRGSVGYGQAWSDDIQDRWGTVDMQDLLAFFDACLAQMPQLDARRTAVMGGSYGGYMTNWITSQTDRFQAAVTDRSICNLISFGGTSDIGARFWDDELGGNFQRSHDVPHLWQMSPLNYVEQVSTPTLIIHSLDDLRCPIEQGEQWYTALQLHGVPTRFVRFPGEDHELSRSGRPDRRVRRLQEYLDWLKRYL
ncbi:S9 family peptidase [Deinococcus sonorensis]|uniref:S9 family peptidase n=2 Tax=Deinococcus sonorensis TaxID=309891 RepID=A0AAU7U964_9DEIO